MKIQFSKKELPLTWLGDIVFRLITAILFLYTTGKELERGGINPSLFLQAYGIAVIIYATKPIWRIFEIK